MSRGYEYYKSQQETHIAVKLTRPRVCPCCRQPVSLWARGHQQCYVCFVRAYAETTRVLRMAGNG